MSPHEHEFTALYWHFGPYGPQDAHVHDCFDRRCSSVLIGEGRECSKGGVHELKRLSDVAQGSEDE